MLLIILFVIIVGSMCVGLVVVNGIVFLLMLIIFMMFVVFLVLCLFCLNLFGDNKVVSVIFNGGV